MRQHKVFVYGTLMRGESNHHLLRQARFFGPARTPPGYRLFTAGTYPVLCPGGRHAIAGEVYGITQQELILLDELEEYPRFYQRRFIGTPFGPAWIYYQNHPPTGAQLLASGSWRRSRTRRLYPFQRE